MKNIKGFTLIEVIVTITLLAVLMAIVLPISLSYMDDIQEKKILNEAESVLSQARSGAHSDRLSLEGKYLSHSGTYTETDSTLLSLYVSKANGVGIIQSLRYEDGNVTYMKYQYNHSTIVIYTKETNQCVIDNSL